jgi:cell division protein FtsB
MRRSKRRLSKKGRWIIILLIVAIPLFYFSKRIYKFVSSTRQENSLKREIIILKAESQVIRNRINEYKRGNHLEATARDVLGMIKKGEKIYLVPEK